MSRIANNAEDLNFRINKWIALSLFGFLFLLSSVKILVLWNMHAFSFYHFLLFFFFNQVQLTDFENAAFVAFIVLLTRAILSFHLNLLIPLSKVSTKTKGKPRIRWRLVRELILITGLIPTCQVIFRPGTQCLLG